MSAPENKKESIGRPYLPYLVVLGISLLIAAVLYPFLPATIPLQWDLTGHVSRSGSKQVVFLIALIPMLVYWSFKRKHNV